MLYNREFRRRRQQITEQTRQESKRLPEYQMLLSKRYQEPSGYASYRSVCVEVASIIMNAKKAPRNLDSVTAAAAGISHQIAHLELPTFWLNQSLAVALEHTQIPDQLIGVRRVLPGGVVMLPNNFLKTPDGKQITFIGWLHQLPDDDLLDIKITREFNLIPQSSKDGYINWFSSLSNGEVYQGNIKCLSNSVEFGEKIFDINLRSVTNDINEEAERETIVKIEKLIVQVLLLMQARTDLVSDSQVIQSTRGVGFNSQAKAELLQPRWIGKDYKVREEQESAPASGGTHASPRPHWRKGHLRRVPVGPREENQRKWTWIEPTWIYPQEGMQRA